MARVYYGKMIIILAGVSGVGKTTVGKLLAKRLGWQFLDADDFHPQSNIEKMRSGVPLTDDDRRDWLISVREMIERFIYANANTIVACSALKRSYRDELRVDESVEIFVLTADFETVRNRIQTRCDHFMPMSLLASQFETLEIESDGTTVNSLREPDDLVAEIAQKLSHINGGRSPIR